MKYKMDCWVFECKGCGHLIFIKKEKNLIRLTSYECPECKLLDSKNWVFIGEGCSKTLDWK